MAEAKDAKEILQEVLTPAMVREIWSVNYTPALPFTLQDFSVGALLPAAMYMFRRGHRRGAGKFRDAFAPLESELGGTRGGGRPARRSSPSALSVARGLSAAAAIASGFGGGTIGQSVLADLLLCHCVENQRHEPGRDRELIRAFPTHFLSAWIDLPAHVGHLRQVPDLLVTVLANQKSGESITPDETMRSRFRVAAGFSENLLMRILATGMAPRPSVAAQHDLNTEEFREEADVGIDQLVTIRIAQKCGSAPHKLLEGKGSSTIAIQHPIATQAARSFNEDYRIAPAEPPNPREPSSRPRTLDRDQRRGVDEAITRTVFSQRGRKRVARGTR